jgi:hypothetical protein
VLLVLGFVGDPVEIAGDGLKPVAKAVEANGAGNFWSRLVREVVEDFVSAPGESERGRVVGRALCLFHAAIIRRQE